MRVLEVFISIIGPSPDSPPLREAQSSYPYTPVSIHTLILIGIAFIAVASLLALLHAIARAEEGFEDETGYPRKNSDHGVDSPPATTVDTGNPWDQIEGSSCPWSFKPTLGHSDFSPHQQ